MESHVTTLLGFLARLDNSKLTPRDIRIMAGIERAPGCCGNDLVVALRLPSRSSVQANIPKLIRRGMIDDLRAREGSAIPSRLFLTEEGKRFLQEMFA